MLMRAKTVRPTEEAAGARFEHLARRVFRCIIYRQSIQGARELREKLIAGIEAIAEKSFRFDLLQGGSCRFPRKRMRPDHCVYDFEIPECFWKVTARLFLRIIQDGVHTSSGPRSQKEKSLANGCPLMSSSLSPYCRFSPYD